MYVGNGKCSFFQGKRNLENSSAATQFFCLPSEKHLLYKEIICSQRVLLYKERGLLYIQRGLLYKERGQLYLKGSTL